MIRARILSFIIIFGLLVASRIATAQNSAPYQLKEPSVQEYLAQIDAVLQMADLYHPLSQHENAFVAATAMKDEFNWRFFERGQLNYEQLASIYRSYATGEVYPNTPPDKRWLPELISLWLNENSVNLDESSLLEFDGFRIETEPLIASVNGYGGVQWGYFLNPVEELAYGGRNFVAIETGEGYVLPELPAAMNSGPLFVGDMNQDNSPDIAYLYSAAINNSYNSGSLILASLRDNHFELLGQLGYFQGGYSFPPSNYNWWFTPMGEEQKIGVLQSQHLGTNWDCDFAELRFYGWNSLNEFGFQSSEAIYPDTVACLVLQAEQMMWQHDYNRAIQFYEEAFALRTPSENLMPYAQIRLGLAYLLTGQNEEASEQFSQLRSSESDFAQTVLTSYERDPRPLALCQAMYNYVFYGEEDIQSRGVMDTYDGGFNRFEAGFFDFNVDNVACDLEFTLNEQLSAMSFSLIEAPQSQLEALGLEIGSSIEADFTGDGLADWLLWVNAPGIPALFFTSTGEGYELSRHQRLYPASDANRYEIINLPNSSELALVNLNFDIDMREVYNCAGGCGGGPSYVCAYGENTSLPRRIGTLSIWRFQAETLASIFDAPSCEFLEIYDVFGSDANFRELHAGTEVYIPDSDYAEIQAAVYIWDEATQTYVLSPDTETTLTSVPNPGTATSVPTQAPSFHLTGYDFNRLQYAFASGDYETVLDITSLALQTEASEYEAAFEFAFRYYRAMALELLNRPDEALAEYIVISEAVPESSWGILANLHLERRSSDE